MDSEAGRNTILFGNWVETEFGRMWAKFCLDLFEIEVRER